jgi:hypothetical protein
MIAATLSGGNTELLVPAQAQQQIESPEISSEQTEISEKENIKENSQLNLETKKTTKEHVEEYFSDMPILVDIASCESNFRQFGNDGQVLRGNYNPQDVGVMQINERFHKGKSVELGLDLHTLEGNMAYARYLYETQGTKPWEYSSKCWSKNREVALN